MNKDLLYTLRWNLKNPDDTTEAENLKIISALLGESPRETTYDIANPAINTNPIVFDDRLGPRGKVALVVGHNSRNKGAYIKGSFNQFEFDFNNEIAALMIASAWQGLEMKRFSRKDLGGYSREISECYGRVNAWNPDFILELHFNSSPGGDYCFMLHHHASKKSRDAAQVINETFIDQTGFKSGQENAARSSGQRGYLSLARSIAPCVLTEPFFEGNPEHLAKIEEFGHAGLAEIYMDGIRRALPIVL